MRQRVLYLSFIVALSSSKVLSQNQSAEYGTSKASQTESPSVLTQAYALVQSLLVWTAIPIAAEFALAFVDSKIDAKQIYLKSLHKTHAASIRKTTSEHSSERLRSMIQYGSSSLFEESPPSVQETESELHHRGLALQARLGTEAGKQRLGFGHFKPILDLLLQETSRELRKANLERAAALLAHTAFLARFLQPELLPTDPLFLNPLHLFLSDSLATIDRTDFYQRIFQHLLASQADLEEQEVYKVYLPYLSIWLLTDEEHISTDPFFEFPPCEANAAQAVPANHTDAGNTYMPQAALLTGALVPAMFCGRLPYWLMPIDKLIEFAASNIGDALIRPFVSDGTSSGRRFLQSLAIQKIGNLEAKGVSQTEASLRSAQARVTTMLSERSLRMRANIVRVLGILVPKCLAVYNHLARQDLKTAAAVFADTFIYLRQMNPESGIQDPFISRTVQSVLGSKMPNLDAFKTQAFASIALLDENYATDRSVQSYYQETFNYWSNNAQH